MMEGVCRMHNHFISRRIKTVLLSWMLLLILSQSSSCNGQCSNSAGCFPPVGNLALGRTVSSTSTCSSGSEFCIFGSSVCDFCDPNTTHLISNINDNNNGTVWLSEIGSLSEVTLQLDFEAPVLFERSVLVWQSARPQSMVLERSHDNGQTWIPYRYYSASCNSSFMLPNTPMTPDTILGSTDAICTSLESQLFPTTNGLVTFSTSQHLPPSTPMDVVLAYRQITNLRVRLTSMFQLVLPPDLRYQYFAVSEWIVEGTCMCNGHASMCAPAPGESMAQDKVYAGCMCQHNSAGVHCGECATGFNNVLWTPGTETEANVCQACMCNGHAVDCQYVQSSMSALCINCTDNTVGAMCEQCLPQFYQDATLLLDDPNICLACDCNQAGINDSGLCDPMGQCNCKDNVDPTSTRCDQCVDGFWNLTSSNPLGCQECDCESIGTTQVNGRSFCDNSTGQCDCRENVLGDRCNECMPGFYDLSAGCLSCRCNLGGSESAVCDQSSPVAQCPCRPNIDSTTCTSPLPGYYFRPLDHILFEAEGAALTEGSTVVYPVNGPPFTGRGLVSLSHRGAATFVVQVPRDSQYELIIRYQATMQVDSVTFRISTLGNETANLNFNCAPTNGTVFRFLGPATLLPGQRYHRYDSVCLASTARYEVMVEYNTFTATTEWLLDSLLLMPDFSATSAYYATQSPQVRRDIIEPCLPREASAAAPPLECVEPSFTLSTEFFGQVYACDCNTTGSVNGSTCAAFGGGCAPCQPGVTGRQCDRCRNGWFNFSVGGCQACNCHPDGSSSPVCDFQTGQCSCEAGTESRTCGDCLPGYFNLTSGGCSLCECSQNAVSNVCDSSGQCMCPSGVGGLKCDQCLDGHYNLSTDGCLPCDCNLLGSASNVCDVTSGQCSCIENTIGQTCNRCPVGYFMTDGVSRDRCVQCTCSGRSDTCTADTENYALGAVQSEFTALCALTPSNCSDGWQLLTASGQTAIIGPSDASGFGYILVVNDDPQLFAPEKFLGNRQASYGLSFRVEATISNTGTINRGTTFIRMTGSLLNETLVGTFPPPVVTQDGITVERFLTYSIPLVEDNWRVRSSTGSDATFFQLYSVLSDVTELSFSAEFTGDFIEFVHIRTISFQAAIRRDEINMTSDIALINAPLPVEDCTCPAAFAGQSCQECSRGHARPSGDPADLCVQCNCNNLTLDCDASTGVCLNCGGSSEGPNCERCMPGFYGDPTRDIPCSPCTCPTLANSFSPTCLLDADDRQTCDSCATGYTGRNCESCMDGFFGSPLMGRCTTCGCNGNVDSALGPVCNTTTGQCLNCLNNTMGFECDQCIPGFYGDPGFGIPCRACQCNPNGTVGDCDPVTGTCTCRPLVTGSRCEQCEDEFWGLSQGLGCIPCDCCNNGSISNVCNKDTGRCDCQPNVGSTVDDKCCTCTPGFFNFSTTSGCQACNCSTLAVSDECDIVTGMCQCQPGAVGLRCNDCAFGFFGTFPNCQPCHECFQQWYDIINDIASRVSIARRQIEILITVNYGDYTVERIESELSSLLVQLEMANETFSNITLQANDISALEQSLSDLNMTLTSLTESVAGIEQQLDTYQMTLDAVNAFNGSVNQITVQNVRNTTMSYDSTLVALAESANASLAQLLQDQSLVNNTWIVAENLNVTVESLLTAISQSDGNLSIAVSLVDDFRADFSSLMSNLTLLDMRASTLLTQVGVLSQAANNASQDVSTANSSAHDLIMNVGQRRTLANATLALARDVNSSVEAARAAAQETLNSANALMSVTEQVVMDARTTLDTIASNLTNTDMLMQQLNTAKSVAQNVLNLPLPSLEYATDLARQINESIVPDDVVQEILANATSSRMAAEQALETALNASAAVTVAQTLVTGVQEDLNCTTAAQGRVMEAIPRVQELVNQTREDVQEVAATSAMVMQTADQADVMFNDARNNIARADGVGMTNRQTADELLNRAADTANVSQQYQNDVDDAVADYSFLQTSVNTTSDEAASTLQSAQQLQTQAEAVNATANAVTLQQLNDLLTEYITERQMVVDLSAEVSLLQQELQSLTTSLNQAAERLQRCYETP